MTIDPSSPEKFFEYYIHIHHNTKPRLLIGTSHVMLFYALYNALMSNPTILFSRNKDMCCFRKRYDHLRALNNTPTNCQLTLWALQLVRGAPSQSPLNLRK